MQFQRIYPQQVSSMNPHLVYPSQSYSLPVAVTAAQTGLDMSTFLPMMIQMMMMVMVMKMMTSAVGGISSKKETKPVATPVAAK